MATNSTTTALIVGAGALTDFIMRGKWTWRAFTVSCCGAVIGYALGLLIVYYLPWVRDAPEEVKYAVTFFCGLFSQPAIHRINKMTLKASIGGIEVQSNGDDK